MQVLDRTGVGTLWSICKTKFALAGHTHNSLAAVGNELISATAYGSGLHFKPYYSSGGPTNYGNILEYTSTNTGGGQLAMEWTGSQTKSDGTDSNVGRVYYRSKRDCINGWTKWMALAYTNDIPTKLSLLTNDKEFVTGSVSGNTVTINGVSTTWSNTWRGIHDNLTSTSTSESLSANLGRVLKGLVDGKANSSHTHNYLPLSGGTLTGDLLFSNSGTTFRQIRGTCGDNDFWRIGGGATGNNAGYMEIATADDGAEPIYVRQYSGTFSTIKRTATLLDGSGNTSFPGTVSAAKFKGALEGNASTASNASTVNGHTVNANVPSNAKFTDTEYVIPTISSAPTSSTLTFTDNGVTRSFKVGYMCRVADSSAEHGYKFYQLYDISGNNAIWDEISGGGGDYYETVTVILTSSISSSDSKLNGAVVTVKNTMTNEIQTHTWNGIPLLFKIPSVNTYTVSVSDIQFYVTPEMQSFTAGVGTNRIVTISYRHIPVGIYIYDTDGNFTKVDDWDTANNRNAVGVSVCTENCGFVIAPTGDPAATEWGGYDTTISGIVTSTDMETAKKDYAGETNTDKIVAQLGTSNTTAALFCRNYTFKNGKKGYLWSLGEAQDALKNVVAINKAMIKISTCDMTKFGFLWTSTQVSSKLAWMLNFYNGSVKKDYKDLARNIIPVCSLYSFKTLSIFESKHEGASN